MATPLQGTPATMGSGGDVELRIHRVEHGLLPSILVRGERPPEISLHEEMARRRIPGVSIAVIDRGAIAWVRAYGVTEAGTSDSVTTETLFQAGSVSKPIAAMTALHLVEEGRLELDRDVNQFLRSWRIPPSDSSKDVAVTLRMLLTHSAGLTVHGFPGYAMGESIPSLVQVLDGVRPANTPPIRVDMRPGRTFRYSGGGFCVVQQLLTDVTSQTYPEIVQRTVLGPLSMFHSTFEQPDGQVANVHRSTGHDRKGLPVPGRWHRYPELSAAGLWTTPHDLALLLLEVEASSQGSSSRVLSPTMTRAMLSSQITAKQGIGWRLDGRGSAARFEHGGDTEGYACGVVGYPERGKGAVVMTNATGGSDLVNEILRAIAKEYRWPNYLPVERRVVAVPKAQLSRLAGRYALDQAPNVLIDISTEGDSLFATVIQPSGTERAAVLAESPTRFFERDSGLELEFETQMDRGPRFLIIRQGDEKYRATALRSVKGKVE